MTEKQFTDIEMLDNTLYIKVCGETQIFNEDKIEEVLNNLYDENEQLQKKNDNLVNMIARVQYRADLIKEENEQLKQQMQRLYNYFADWFDDRVPPSDFSEMWDFVKEDEKWD
jgi:predicted nuclease with TOPRIM domain